jgi:hypothetical protein
MTRTRRVSKNGLVAMLVGVNVTQRPSCSVNMGFAVADDWAAVWVFWLIGRFFTKGEADG